jgi:universal stress protein E
MDSIKNILVIVDPTASDQPVVHKAGLLAAKLRASIELLACDTEASATLRIMHRITGRASPSSPNQKAWLEDLAKPLRSQGIEVTTSAIGGDPLVDTLLGWFKNSPADLVMKDTHHHSALKRTFLGNTDWRLIRECSIPLLLTKPTRWPEHLTLAAAVDPPLKGSREDHLDQRILDCAVSIARSMHAKVLAVHTYFPDIVAAAAICPQPNFFSVTDEMLEAEKSAHEKALTPLLAPYAIAPSCVQVEMGVASASLPAIAADRAIDVMVMGAISRSHAKQALLGSTAERLLEFLPCDVLVVKEICFADCLPLYGT